MDDGKIIEFASDFVFFDNGHYVIGLPFTSESVAKPNNWKQTEQRLDSLCKILKGKVSSITVIIPLKIQLLISDMRKVPAPRRRTCVILTTPLRVSRNKKKTLLAVIVQRGLTGLIKNTFYRILT